MKVKEILTKIFAFKEEMATPVATTPEENKYPNNAVLQNGTQVCFDNLGPNGNIALMNQDGTYSALPIGKYMLEDGKTQITCEKDGVITSVATIDPNAVQEEKIRTEGSKETPEVIAAVETPEVPTETPDVEKPDTEDVNKDSELITKITDLETEITGLKTAIQELLDIVGKQGEMAKTLDKRVKTVEKLPADLPIEKKFEKQINNSKETIDRFEIFKQTNSLLSQKLNK